MKVLMLSTDKALFDESAPVRARLLEYASLVSELYVVVYTPKGEQYKEQSPGNHLHLYPTRSSGKFSYLPDAYRKAREIIAKHGKREEWLITTQDPFDTGAVGYLLSKLNNIPVHMQLHTDPWSDAWKRSGMLNRMRAMLALYLLPRADGIRVVSLRLKKRLLAMGIAEAKITQIPVYVDVNYFHDTEPTFDLHQSYAGSSDIILSIGRLSREKNYSGLIRAFAKIHKTHEGAVLIIVGSGPERDRLIHLTRFLGVSDEVKILPWARETVSYYKTCDIYVQPSLYEGYGMALIEAMASGAPVLMTDVGCAGEVVVSEETGLVVKVGNEEELLFALERFLFDRALRLKLAAQGQQKVLTLPSKADTLVLYRESWERAYRQVKSS